MIRNIEQRGHPGRIVDRGNRFLPDIVKITKLTGVGVEIFRKTDCLESRDVLYGLVTIRLGYPFRAIFQEVASLDIIKKIDLETVKVFGKLFQVGRHGQVSLQQVTSHPLYQ